MVLIQETVTESEDSPERPVAGLRGSVEIVAWRVRGGQRALATGASRVSPPVGVFLVWGVWRGRQSGAVVAPEQLRAGVAEPPGPHGQQAGDTCRGRGAQHPAEGRMALFQTLVGASEG